MKKELKMEINDCVYGNENIEEPVLIDLINSQPLQRLKGLNQYGMPDEYWHKKNYSRYDHSVGVMILLRRLKASLEEQIAGLLHDVSHFSFSHVIDGVMGDPIREDYQDNNHQNFIKSSKIKNILDSYSYDPNKISRIENFCLLEREITSLCADRIDYCLRELQKDGSLFDTYVPNLSTHNRQVIFRDRDIAKRFANEFLRLQESHWAGKDARGRYFVLSRILKRALDINVVSIDDFYMTDYEVINKLKNSNDDYIIDNLSLLRSRSFVKEVYEGGILPKKKFRYIDPEVWFNGTIKRLSEVSEDYREVLIKAKEKSKNEMRVIFKSN